MNYQHRHGHKPAELGGHVACLAICAILLLSHGPRGYAEVPQLNGRQDHLIALDQSQEIGVKNRTSGSRLARRTKSHDSNVHLRLEDRKNFENVLLTDFPGTFLLYVKLKEQDREYIFWQYTQTGKMEMVREAVIEKSGHDNIEDN